MQFNHVFRLRLFGFISCLMLTAFVDAQTTSASPASASSTAASSSTRQPVTRTVSVGYAGFTFQPEVTLANVGDTIEFDFFPANHSVVRSLFGYPCIPYEMTGVDRVGFSSGFKVVDAILSDPPKYQVLVNDTEPIFFYCTAPGSCIDHGMVGAINPNATQTSAEQKQLAKAASFMLQPGEPWPSESTPDPFTTSAPGPTATNEATSSTPAAASGSTEYHHAKLSGGAIAGIVIGGIAALILVGVFFYLCGRNRTLSDLLGENQAHGQATHMDPRQSLMSGTTAYGSEPKHLSGFTVYPRPNSEGPYNQSPSHPGSPGLPQYTNLQHTQHSPQSPSLRGEYTSLPSVMQRDYMTRSPSPAQVPAYSASPPHSHELPQNNFGPHEMPADTVEWGRRGKPEGRESGGIV